MNTNPIVLACVIEILLSGMRTLRGGDGGGSAGRVGTRGRGGLRPGNWAHQPRLLRFWRGEPQAAMADRGAAAAVVLASRKPRSRRSGKASGQPMSLRMSAGRALR